jgi:CMP-N,N'-diacetyllegionaminic acid synthase
MTGQTIAIIPARGGSKSLPRKNLRAVLGRTLLDYAVRAGLDARSVDRTLVTTEDAEIARAAREMGAELVDRPPELATDESPTVDAVLHAIDALEARGVPVGTVVLLQPTSPLRTAADVDAAVELHAEGGCDSVVSVARNGHPPQWSFTIEGGLLRPLMGDGYLRMRRQDVPPSYATVGAVFVASPAALRRFGGFYGDMVRPYVMPSERSVDVDSELDLALVELVMSRGADRKGPQGGGGP